jgi:hypothetical protein
MLALLPAGLDTQSTMKLPMVFNVCTISEGVFPNAGVVSNPARPSTAGTTLRPEPLFNTYRHHCLLAFPFFILYMRPDLARFEALIGKFASTIGSNSFFNAPA